jgi:hypothetical protein
VQIPETRDGRVHFMAPPQKTTWSMEQQGNVFQVREMWNWNQTRLTVKREATGMMSRASRLRLLKAINAIDWKARTWYLLVTLTYPDSCRERSVAQITQDKYLFHRYIEKYIGKKTAMLWRKEWQVRKSGKLKGELMPHMHLVLFNVAFIPHDLLREWWRTILGVSNAICTDVRRVQGEKAARYTAMYAGKKSLHSSLDIAAYLNRRVGRPWGFTRKELICWHKKRLVRGLTASQLAIAREMAHAAYSGGTGDYKQGFTIFGPAGRKIFAAVCLGGIDRADTG